MPKTCAYTNFTENHFLTSQPGVKILITNKVLSHENKNGKEKNAFVIIILLTINLTNNSSE